MRLSALSVAIGSVLATPYLLAEERVEQLGDIYVEGEVETAPAVIMQPVESNSLGLPADGGDFLRDLNGVSGIRMGGHGIDPVIRGQSQNRLNILLDGAYIHGGCPNRMDPPTAYSAMESYDSVTVIKGSQTVIYGGGGSGGTVLFERKPPRFEAGKNYLGQVDAGYKSNSKTKEFSADIAAGSESGYVRGVVGYKDADNYEDGDANEVRSAFENRSGNLILGYTPDQVRRLELNIEATREDDALYAGAGMDSPMSDADNLRFKFEQNDSLGPFSGLDVEIYSSQVDHLMDNYSLRELTAPMRMSVPTTSDTTGGRLFGDLMLGENSLTIGVDYQKNERDADRFSGMPTMEPATLQSIMWPGAELEQTGLFAELDMPVGEENSLKVGVRYDQVDASISRGDEKPDLGPSPTPNNLYAAYYADTSDSQSENNVGGFVRYSHKLGGGTMFAGISRSIRTADATERYLASFMRNMMTGMDNSWVGNPELEPEQHHQLEVGYKWQSGEVSSDITLYYNDVSDFILRDKARGQEGILVANGTATIYRNVDAEFYGIEWQADYRLSSALMAKASLAYVRAENTTDDRPIAQIAPLDLSLGLDYSGGDWELGGALRANAKQTRADLEDGSGQDVQETPGWGVIDLYGRYRLTKNSSIRFGVDNLLDKSFAYHVNRANVDPFNPEAIQVNEPGRELWVRGAVEF
ncbi:MAG: TonB-dependent copper receptor [gamma proteobacterium symbiont of Ctena orbiculata]|nr:MAG: TonB-dependent copper receptor [gamma proteobacterium symbiont of Ctena orbiculata]PVV10832.1 MAG: TonB-dependent copper receptor [gamma proteobacterium symbiont of Ctena orbiculata]PVV13241.1 MAG: TonB-dependent copper receptor [gamma proteobacterium symbiont of Ctena orbiculata]PVV24129.1 MAG: TonB-dependent copper receptor [gamma proteobacterium symbiont of Ctena orbiculata]